MLLISVAVFMAVFLVVALLLTAMGTGASQQMKQTLERLDSVLLSTSEGRRRSARYPPRGASQHHSLAEPVAATNRFVSAIAPAALPGRSELDRGRIDADVRLLLGGCRQPGLLAHGRERCSRISSGLAAAMAPIVLCALQAQPAIQRFRGKASRMRWT